MLVPATTIPVTIIGAFAAMAALGFTINTTTMFGIVLAIGIVVDDAIVIVEGVARHIERGLTPTTPPSRPWTSCWAGHRHHPGADVCVHTGRLRARPDRPDVRPVRPGDRGNGTHQRDQCRHLKPTQCALWLRAAVPPEKRNFFFRGFNNVYQRLENAYGSLIGAMAKRSGLMVLLASSWPHRRLGVARLPTAFIPTRTRATWWSACSCPTAPRWSAPMRRWPR